MADLSDPSGGSVDNGQKGTLEALEWRNKSQHAGLKLTLARREEEMQRVVNIHQRAERAVFFLEKKQWGNERTGPSLLRACFAAVDSDLTVASEVVIQQERVMGLSALGGMLNSGVIFTINTQKRDFFTLNYGGVQARPQGELRREFAFRNESATQLFLKPTLVASSGSGAPIQWNRKTLHVARDSTEKMVFALCKLHLSHAGALTQFPSRHVEQIACSRLAFCTFCALMHCSGFLPIAHLATR